MSNRRKLRSPAPMPPHVQAMADQAQAAARPLIGAFHEFEARHGERRDYGRVSYGILEQFRSQQLAGTLRLCPHLSWDRPAPTFWQPWLPQLAMCPACSEAAGLGITGTDEDRRCDGCGRVVEQIRPSVAMIPAAVAEIGHRPQVMVTFGLCRACSDEDSRPYTPDEDEPGYPSWYLASGESGWEHL